MKSSLSQELKWRGFSHQNNLKESDLDNKNFTFYFGVDPSADSMTIGNLSTAMMVKHFIAHGHKAVLLVGGATGIIGDPDGKAQERNLIEQNKLDQNISGIVKQYKDLFEEEKIEIVNNLDWFSNLNYVEFLRDIGKHVPMRQMLGRDFVKSRIGEDGTGISYAEFSYSLMQGYDFLHLYRTKGVTLQVCGSDQWGNSIAGVELIRRIEGAESYVYTSPLMVDKSTGHKFGKTEAGAIWLDEKKTPVFDFYQFWLNVDDDSTEQYLKIYTLLSKDEIEETLDSFKKNRSNRAAQKKLAYEVTKIVHGELKAKAASKLTEILFETNDYTSLSEEQIELLKKSFKVINTQPGESVISVLAKSELFSSKSEVRRMLEQKGIYINGNLLEPDYVVDKGDFIEPNAVAVIRKGKNNFVILSL